MKTLFFIIFILIFLGCSSNDRNITYQEVNNIDLKKYEGKEVSEFLNEINEEYIDFYYHQEPPCRLRGFKFIYNNYSISIYISTFNYVKEYEFEMKWNIDDFMKEKISYIKIERLRP